MAQHDDDDDDDNDDDLTPEKIISGMFKNV